MKKTKHGNLKQRQVRRVLTAVLFLSMTILGGCPSVVDPPPSEEPGDTDNNAAATPIFSHPPYNGFTSAQTLTITSRTGGTTAHYEFATSDTNSDGDIDPDDVSTPTPASTAYTAPISILPNVGDVYCIKVIAHDAGGTYANSSVVSRCYSRRLSAPGITPGGWTTSLTVAMSHSLTGVTIYYRAASDATTDLSAAIDPNDITTYTGTGTTVTPAGFSAVGDVYRIKAVAVLANGRRSPETVIQRFDYAGGIAADVDADNDGLIEIHNLDMFNNIRFNLAGTSYDQEEADTDKGNIGNTSGGPTSATTACPTDSDDDGIFLCGYELMGNLDFALPASYASGMVNTTWCPDTSNNCIGSTTEAGFPGIGAARSFVFGFNAIFEGNDNTITNFYSRNTSCSGTSHSRCNIGLFRIMNRAAQIRNLTVTNANVYGGTGNDRVGILVGLNQKTITASSASGNANGGAGDDEVGGLVGYNVGTITKSSATGNVDGGIDADAVGGLVGYNDGGTIAESSASGTGRVDGGSENDFVGGLVGANSEGTIVASYASGTGSVDGESGSDDAGGLVGYNTRSTIAASHASVNANGGAGNYDFVGGLVGRNNSSTITASYATGNASGGDGDSDWVGGLVGVGNGTPSLGGSTIVASYATGDARGGSGTNDKVGGLAGATFIGTIAASYATGDADGGDGDSDWVGGLVGHHVSLYSANTSTIIASYATGIASGGAGTDDDVGGLVGLTNDEAVRYDHDGIITESYSFGTVMDEETIGSAGSTPWPTLQGGGDITSATQLGASRDRHHR